MNEFLNPKATLTPGGAGATTTLIANTIANAFSIPAPITALVVSFLFASFAFTSEVLRGWQRPVFFVLNGLVIFAVALGANVAGRSVSGTAPSTTNSTTLIIPPDGHLDERLTSQIESWLPQGTDSVTAVALGEVVSVHRRGNVEVTLPHNRRVLVERRPADNSVLFETGIGHNPAIIGNARAITLTERPASEFFGDWFIRRQRITAKAGSSGHR